MPSGQKISLDDMLSDDDNELELNQINSLGMHKGQVPQNQAHLIHQQNQGQMSSQQMGHHQQGLNQQMQSMQSHQQHQQQQNMMGSSVARHPSGNYVPAQQSSADATLSMVTEALNAVKSAIDNQTENIKAMASQNNSRSASRAEMIESSYERNLGHWEMFETDAGLELLLVSKSY